jgi:polysaccharide biosynthesis transport protein
MTVDIKRETNKEEIIDLRQYWNLIWGNKWKIISFSLLITILTGFLAMRMTPIYRATSTLLIEASETKAVSIEEVYGLSSNNKEYLQTQFEILKSKDLAMRVVENYQLANHPLIVDMVNTQSMLDKLKEMLPTAAEQAKRGNTEELTEEDYRKAAISYVRANVSISPIRKTQLVNISFESSSPEFSQMIADAIGDEYIASQFDAKLLVTNQASVWLEQRLSQLTDELDGSEEVLQSFIETNNIIDVEGIRGLIAADLNEITDKLNTEKTRLVRAEELIRDVKIKTITTVRQIEKNSTLLSDERILNLQTNLVETRQKLSDLSNVYGPKHPKLKSATSELTTVEQEMIQLANSIVSSSNKEFKDAKFAVNLYETRLQALKVQFQTAAKNEAGYQRLLREVETNKQLHDTFLSRFKETEFASGFDSPIARFTDRASLPEDPVKPNKKLIVALAMVASGGFIVVLIFMMDALNDTVRRRIDIEEKLGQRFIGAVPKSKLNKKGYIPAFAFGDEKYRVFSESIKSLRTGIMLADGNQESKVIMITSSSPSEGKTTVSVNMALAYAKVGKTLLIDADLRKPSVANRLDIPGYQQGLNQALNDTAELNEIIAHRESDNLDVLVAGPASSHALELFNSDAFSQMMKTLRAQYEYIIVDTAPIAAVSDALVVGQHVDTTLLVVKADATRNGVIKSSVNALIDSHIKITGVVLNNMDFKKAAKQDVYYEYYGQYGE